MIDDERAVSEVLGYVLVIGLVTVTVAVVMTVGISGLEASQQSERTNNVERAFDVMAHNFETSFKRGAPSRATEIRLAGGEISYGDTVTINVTQNGEVIENRTIETVPIVYDDQSGTRIVYEGGALIREDEDRSVMLRPPYFILDEEDVVITGVRTRPRGGTVTLVEGPGTVLLNSEGLPASTAQGSAADGPINVTVESPRAMAWERYFERQETGNVRFDDEEQVTYEIDSSEYETVSVVRALIRISLFE